MKFWFTKKTDYNSFADEFSKTRKSPWPEILFFQEYLQGMSSFFLRKPRVVDIGCGNGRAVPFLEKAGALVSGVDLSENIIQQAKQLNPGRTFHVGDAVALPFSDHFVEFITAFALFPHLINHRQRKKAFLECFRVLCHGGVLFGTVWNLDQKIFLSAKKKAWLRSLLPLWEKNDFVIPWGKKKIPRLYYRFTEDSLKKYLEDSGFKEIEIFSIVHGRKAPPKMGKNICFLAKKPKKIHILSTSFDILSLSQTLSILYKSVQKNTQTFIVMPNIKTCVLAKSNPTLRYVLNAAHYSFPSDTNILWAADYLTFPQKNIFLSYFSFRLFPKPKVLSEHIQASNLFFSFCKRTRQPIFLLGEGATECAEKFGNHIVGTDSRIPCLNNEQKILKRINGSGARVLFVAFGSSLQEEWIYKNLKNIPHIRLAISLGDSFEFSSKKRKHALQRRKEKSLFTLWNFLKAIKRQKNKCLQKTI